MYFALNVRGHLQIHNRYAYSSSVTAWVVLRYGFLFQTAMTCFSIVYFHIFTAGLKKMLSCD